MGTKIVERITTNTLGLKSVDRSGFIRFGVNGRRKSSKETLIDDKEEEEEGVSIIRSMDRFLEKQNAESIRHTMQAQEDIFKQQVRYIYASLYGFGLLIRFHVWFLFRFLGFYLFKVTKLKSKFSNGSAWNDSFLFINGI